jgi:hypothetical protein
VASHDTLYVGNIPFIYAWIFAWFVVTSGCLGVCWLLFDKRAGARDA